jgi:phosphate transport system protein
MSRLLDTGLNELSSIISEMAELAERTVDASIRAYLEGATIDIQIRAWSDALRSLHDSLEEKAVDLIARYQPVATDLRMIKSSMKIAYDLSRFGRYALDISTVLGILNARAEQADETIEKLGKKTVAALHISIEIFRTRNFELMGKLGDLENEIDELYRTYLRNMVEKSPKNNQTLISNVLVSRHLERIADHACYIAEETYYMVHGRTMYLR